MKKLYFLLAITGLVQLSAEARTINLTGVDTYGSLIGPDGTDWFYTQNFTASEEFNYAYKSSDITIYDNEMDEVMTIHYDVPAGVKCNTIEPYGKVTKNFFDYKEASFEVMVYVHSLGAYDESTSSYEQIHENYIFSAEYEEEAEQIFKYNCQNLGILDASQGYDINQRLCLVTQEGDTMKAEIYKRGKWSSKGTSAPILEHTFTLPFDNVNYQVGSWVNTYTIDGKFYYVISYYEKPYSTEVDENYEPIRTEDNYFIADVYDQDYNIVQKVRISADPNPGSPFTFHGIGRFGEDLTKGFYSGDDKLNLIVCYDNYIISSDESEYDFKVFTQEIAEDGVESEPIKTIFEGIQTWNFLSDIPGHESQIGVLRGTGVADEDGDEGSEIAFINLPSCQEVATLPSILNGHKVNWNFDRVAVGSNDYNYVFALNEGEMNEETRELLGLIGWYSRDGKEVRVDSMSIGARGQMFKPTLSSDFAVGRYVFNNDDLVEYPYLAKMTKKGSTAVESVVRIANQKGEIIKEYKAAKGKTLTTASFLNYKSTNPWMIIVWTDDNTQKCDISIETIPFTSMEGTGKEADPYLIRTAGDVAQIASKGSGCYKVMNDIDMSILGKQYIPVTNFSGIIDGDGHTISNLSVDANTFNLGLIGTAIYGTSYAKNHIKNLTLESPTITTGSQTAHAGFFVGWAQNTKFTDCFVKGGYMDATQSSTVAGGIVGQMGTQSGIQTCGVYDTDFEAPYSSVGGIVGKAIFGSGVSACAVTDCDINGGSSVGGIMGEAEDGSSPVSDCHVVASVRGKNAVGGVVGASGRSNIHHNFIELKNFASELDTRDNKYAAGGVVGAVETDWDGSTSSAVFVGNVVTLADGTSADIWGNIQGKDAWHRIIGFSAADEEYEAGETHKKEKGANNNYATSSLTANGSKGAKTVDGADLPEMSRQFFQNLEYNYGETASAPWQDNYGKPYLYFETVDLDPDRVQTVRETTSQADGIYSLSGMKLRNTNAKGIKIIVKDGKVRKTI